MSIKLKATTGGGSVALDAPNATTGNADVVLTLPVDDGTSGQYLQTDGAGALSWQTVSSTPDAITEGDTSAEVIDTGSDGRFVVTADGTERLRVDSSGAKITSGALHIDGLGNATNNYITLRSGTSPSAAGGSGFKAVDHSGANEDGLGCYGHDGVSFYTGQTERMRLTSGGHLYVHNDVQYSSSYTQMPYTGNDNITLGVRFNTNVSGKQYGIEIQNTAGVANSYACIFSNGSSQVGSILMQTASTQFNTTSDYRLKENVVNLDGAINRVKQLAPKRFNFIIDPSNTVDGFLAHEVQPIVPEAISGVKDEVRVWQEGDELPDGVSVGDNKLDEDGNTIPEYQGIDQSKLVPLLTAALQEAIGKIEALETANAALEARLTALEGGAS